MIIAVDADGVLWKDNFPSVAEPDMGMVRAVRNAIDKGHEVVLWTCRVNSALIVAEDMCRMLELRFCTINDNAPSNVEKWKHEFPGGTRKVYADVYIDDKALGYDRDEAMRFLANVPDVRAETVETAFVTGERIRCD